MNFVTSNLIMASIFGASLTSGPLSPSANTDSTAKTSTAKTIAKTDKTADKPVAKAEATPAPAPAPVEDKVTVNEGDTLSSIADAHQTDYVRLFNANDSLASPDVLNVGTELRVPKADEELPDRYGEYLATIPVYTAPVVQANTNVAYAAPAAATAYQSTAYRGAPSSYSTAAGNTYAWGNCTWYAKNKRPDLPNALGNGGSWAASAAGRGYATGSVARAGAIAEQPGHVAYVESVNADGTVNVSEMNWNGGIGVVHNRTVSAGNFTYIY